MLFKNLMSILSFSTSQYTSSLPIQSVFSATLLLALLTYKIAYILASILISNLVISLRKDKDSLQKLAKWGLLGKFIGFIVLIVSTCVKILSAFVQTILAVFYSFIPFIVLAFVFMIIQQRWGDTAIMVTSVLNDPESPVSLAINYFVRIPLQVLDDVAFYIIPTYNFIIFVVVHIPIEFFANFLFGEGASLVRDGISSFAQSISLMVPAFAKYAKDNHMECPIPEPICWNITVQSCFPVDKSTIAALCLEPSQRQLDSIPFLMAMKDGFASILKALALGCTSLESIINIFFFPLTDPSLWKAIHYFINALLHVLVGAPTSTSARCALGGGFSVRPSLCTPDFAPAFDYAVATVQLLGDVIDNFFDMIYLLVMYGNNAECPGGQSTQHSLFLPLWKDPFIDSLFGSNTTKLVTLTSTLFALTDGQHSVFVTHKKTLERSYFPNAWGPLAVNPRFGIAKVYDKAGEVSMLGCRCIDTDSEMIVQCSTSSSGLQSANTVSFNSTWEVVNAGYFMKCSAVRIIVQSIHWPEGRISLSEKVSTFDTYASTLPKSVKLVADAAVYVIPSCGGNSQSLSCLDSRIFTLSNCYPFCMALHTKNIGHQPLLFRGYSSWMDGVLITDRDCVPTGSISGGQASSTSCSSDSSSSDAMLSASSVSQSNSLQCRYNSICSTWVTNKTNLPPTSFSSIPNIPAFADTTKYVSNVLDGQPLVVAGGLIMRASTHNKDRYVDFPIITGDLYNEFSMEVASPAGIPVAPIALVPGMSIISEKKGFISLPPSYIEMIDIYNPATLSSNALWYAINPSYDWISCFAKWCATEGRDTCVQFMFYSSYTPIRLWKVLYKNSACFIRANDGAHICRDDVATGFSLDPSMDLPKFTSKEINEKLGTLCSGSEFNLWVESMEFYDDFNIAVSVRRGSIKALHNLMQNVLVNSEKVNASTLTASEWYQKINGNELGRTVVYFVHSLNVSLVRLWEPWTSASGVDPGFLSVVHGSGSLCPELRFLPSLGSFFHHSLSSVIYGIKMPVNFLCNMFALIEVLTSRAEHACPADGLGHSVLQDCGMGLFDLSDFFSALQEGNKAFWNILAWVASLIRSMTVESDNAGDNTALKYFESFITGAAVFGEAGHIVSLFQVNDIAENLLDSGIQDTVLGGRRRLLSEECTGGRKLLGAKQISKAAAKGVLSGILNIFSSGVQTIFSISHTLVDATSLAMSSADFGVLLSTMNPTYILGSAVTAPGILWAQFTYETILPLALDLASSVVYAHEMPKSTAIVWVHLHAAKDNFEKLIEPRMEQGCLGLRLMLGYKGGLPTAIYHNCISASRMHSAIFSLSVLIFSEVPFYSCMCVQSSGYEFPDYILANCMEWVPAARKGLWQSIILNSGQESQNLCKWYGDYIHDTAMHVFDGWTMESHSAASSLASFLQDLIVPNAKEMGSCISVNSNPNVFVMLPIPSEHYHICGKTSECRLRCADTFAMFEYELNRYQQLGYDAHKPPQSFDISAESPFFNKYQTSTDSLYYIEDRIVAVSSRNLTSSYLCSTCPADCLVVAKTQWNSISSVSINTYCTPPPSYLQATIFAAGGGSWTFKAPLIDLEGDHFSLTYCNFALQKDDIYVLMAYSSAVMTVSSSGIFAFDSEAAAQNTLRNQERLYAIRYDELDTLKAEQQAIHSLILDTESLTSSLLSTAIQEYVFEKENVYNAYIKECKISELVELATGTRGSLLFFMTLMFTAKGWVKQEDITEDMGFITDEQQASRGSNKAKTSQEVVKTSYLTAIVSWCDPTIPPCKTSSSKHIDYFFPCPCNDEQSILCQKPEYTTGSGCRPGLDAALFLAQRGTFMHVSGNIYLFLPKAGAYDSSGAQMLVQYVEILPDGKETKYPVSPVSSGLQYNNQPLNKPMRLYTPNPTTTKAQLLRQEMGFWSYSDVFSISGLAMRQVRSPLISNNTAAPIRWFQASQPTTATIPWLKEARILLTKKGFELLTTSSQNTTTTAVVKTKCSPYDCASCVSASVRLVCHALQDCMMSRCIGTIINYKNLLCSIGVVVEQLYLQMVTSWRAIYLFVVEISMFVLNGFGGSLSKKVVLSFPTDTFYSLVCACKDVFASFIGMIISAMQNVHGLFDTGRIDIGVNSYVSPQEAIFTTQIRSIGGLFFNIVSDATLYPILAMHRWILCITNSTMDTQTLISVQFGDIGMDQSWGFCSPASAKLSMLMDATELESIVKDDVDGFISYSMDLLSGIGETVLYGAILVYNSFIAFLESIVWNLQNMMIAFNLRTCKVTDYMQRVVLQCACGDTPYYILETNRESTWLDGALWCSGSLAVTLTDGTQGIIFNPYSLKELSNGLSGVTEYIQCLANSTSSQACKKTNSINTLTVLTNQGVEPIAVWAKCKSNYLEQSWDIGAGALFSDNIVTTGISTDITDKTRRQQAQDWAEKIAPEFLQCMQAPLRFYNDYSNCLTMYLNLTSGKLPNAYFLFTQQTALLSKEPPDACMVFSGLNSSSSGKLQQTMQHCIMDLSDPTIDPTLCPFNPTVWYASNPRKIPVAKLFGIVENDGHFLQISNSKIQLLYKTSIDKLKKAFTDFNQTFLQSAKKIQVALFSADGDFIHDFIDCVFLGPYTRVDMLPCDSEGNLECPFYARDENGGIHRNFTACFGSELQGDGGLPFTCGSQARRALIKYFFRIFSWAADGQDSNSTLVHLIQNRISEIISNLTNTNSFGCLDKKTGLCSGGACTRENGYNPCLDMEFAISAANVSKFILQELLQKVDSFYAQSIHDTTPWTMYYNGSRGAPLPAQWGKNKGSAARALEDGIFKPMEPVIKYDVTEVYSMPSHEEEPHVRFSGSIWSLCMGLISQGQMSLAVNNLDGKDDWRPLGVDDNFLSSVDWYDLDNVAFAVRNFTQKAAERSPFIWHKSRVHAPSKSAVCKKSVQFMKARGSRIRIGKVEFNNNGNTYQTPYYDNLSIPYHGFTWGMLGNAHETCICGYDDLELRGKCIFSDEACASIIPQNNQNISCIINLQQICKAPGRYYDKSLLPDIWKCLHVYLPNIRCPELGPSDSWGLFPVDCDSEECISAKQWIGNAQQDVFFEGIRLVTEGRSGLKLSNLQYVNHTYQEAIDYSQQKHPASHYQINKCFDTEELSKTQSKDNSYDALQNWIKGLFPATQLHHDSPVIAYCSRFVIEVARAEALSFVSSSESLQALQAAKIWKRKCHSKIKHLTSCARLGVYYDVPPPSLWKEEYSKHCDVQLDISWGETTPYLTPWCIVVDQRNRTMYDARKCLRNAMTTLERVNAADGKPITRPLHSSDLSEGCKLPVQPLDILLNAMPLSSVYINGAQRLSSEECIELSPTFNPNTVQNFQQDDTISHVLDWWPSTISMPVGFHITSPMIIDELAPIAFDNHYAYDNTTYTLHYVHSALRDQSLSLHAAGSGGLCRAHSVGMPIFETNTNRICTRMPKKGVNDSPHLPVDSPKTESNIPPMGPYNSNIMDEYFEEELCASTYEDVPWPKKADSFDFAGSIPDISKYLDMDKDGYASYSSDFFPPFNVSMLPVKGMFRDWGDCSGAVVWDDSPPCTESSGCPRNTICLKKEGGTGICYSTAAFRAKSTRSPCFRTDHCSNGLVCLADGGCSSLFLHMWNDISNDIQNIEFALMADNCGFQNPIHPFTQSMRGVSPWEQVPDLFHMHGMCSHRNWFAYRNAYRDGVCPLLNSEALECNSSEAFWPDIQMRFDKCRIPSTSSERFSMAQQSSLYMVPHPCDTEYMHSAIQKQRLKVCSGYQGIEKGTSVGNYIKYDLNVIDGSWRGALPELLVESDSVHWMRTYTESTDILTMGNLFKDSFEKYNSRLGLFGAEINSTDPLLHDMSLDDGVRFFRCTDKMVCQMPEYTYGGVTMEYRLNLASTTLSNYTENSARRCGAIGSLLSETSPDVCRLDLELFPLFTYLLKHDIVERAVEEGDGRTISIVKGCLAIWPKSSYFQSSQNNIKMMNFNQYNWNTQLLLLQNSPSTLFCSNNEDVLLCIYSARSSSILSNEKSKGDHVAIITKFINTFFEHTTELIDQAISNHGMLRTYESINLCSQELWEYTPMIQRDIQVRYNSSISSGFYIAFQLSLFEFPQQWFHQCMLSILLSYLDDSITRPDTSLMTSPFQIALPMWSSQWQMDNCAENLIHHRSGLYFMLCHGKHPDYTFHTSENNLIYNLLQVIKEGIMSIATSTLYENQQETTIECFSEVAWNCKGGKGSNDLCSKTLLDYYANCNGEIATRIPDICENSKNTASVFAFQNPRMLSLSELSTTSKTTSNLETFLKSSTKSIEDNSNKQAELNNYITSNRFDSEFDDDYVTLSIVKGIDTSLFSGFINASEWMSQTCQNTLVDPITPCQRNIPEDKTCLFPNKRDQYLDADRYFSQDVGPYFKITLRTNNEIHYKYLCDYYSDVNSPNSYFIIHQYDLDSTLVEDDGPVIVSIEVPPGVWVSAYSSQSIIPREIWDTTASLSNPNLINCAWTGETDKNSWWPKAVGTELKSQYGEGFDGFTIDFETMTTWHGGISSMWGTSGCGAIDAVYALKFNFESPQYSSSGSSLAYPAYSTPYPLAEQGYNDRASNCYPGRSFRVADTLNRNNKSCAIWRCAPCTRFDPIVTKNGFFGCKFAGGIPLDNLFTSDMLQKSFAFLYDEVSLLKLIQSKLIDYFSNSDSFQDIKVVTDNSNGNLKVLTKLKEHSFLASLENWGGLKRADTCNARKQNWECKGFNEGNGFDPSNTILKENILWNKAINNPQQLFTMECEGQKYTSSMQQECNHKVNKKVEYLADFVEKQYRQKNGVWLQKVSQGKGVAWKANVAHSDVGKFTLFYTSGDRPSDQVISKWVLGDGPCNRVTSETSLEDRICVESKKRNLPFEPMHPWIGGDFNPFVGLDECPYISSSLCTKQGRTSGTSNSQISMCPCKCSPQWACEGKDFNYSQVFMDLEFPEDDVCTMQKFTDTRVMHPNDPSNLCSIVQQTTPSSRGCLFPHGLLGGVSDVGKSPVSTTVLHSKDGTSVLDSMSHQLLEKYSTASYISPLWSGQKLPSSSKTMPFLRMSREFIHPAHIAFGLDSTMPTLPLIIKAVALLPAEDVFPDVTAMWVEDLKTEWMAELNVGLEDNPYAKSITFMYPQLLSGWQSKRGDWSCPIRKYAFLAGKDDYFGPLTPNPVSAHAIFGMGGVHPFIKTQGPYANLAPYFTTNGACFFREDPVMWPKIKIDDVENQCGLRGMLYLISSEVESLMSVQESFGSRCNDIIDTPDVGGKLRSGETLKPIPGLKESCGILHRITPALISTKGNRGKVKVKSPLLTTISQGGDCHMGRALQIPTGTLQGKRCSPMTNDFTTICQGVHYSLPRAQPLSLSELINKKEFMYRGDLSYKTDQNKILPRFMGPGENIAPEGSEEISFGLLYSATLKETLANDLLYVCKKTPGCDIQMNKPWIGDSYLDEYVNGSLMNKDSVSFLMQSEERKKIIMNNPLTESNRMEKMVKSQLTAINQELDLWNQTDWTWTFLDHTQAPKGRVNKNTWMHNRTAACSDSFEELLAVTPQEFLQDKVKRITLCAPPPTGDMENLCKAMNQHKVEIEQKNCQIWGKGDCLGNVGMFYLPYMWSSTNQEYSFNTVNDFYKEILKSQYFEEEPNYDTLCNAKTDYTILSTLAMLSQQQNAICPASSLEIFKGMLVSLKKAGSDLLQLAYNQCMMVANIIASVFTTIKSTNSEGKDGSIYLQTAVQYFKQMIPLVTTLFVELLDIIVEMIGMISPIGQVMKEVLSILCTVYNWIMKEIIINVWCLIVRPVVIGVLKAVQALAFMSSHVVDLIQVVLNLVSDGTSSTCIEYYNAKAIAQCPSSNQYSANLSNFQPQPMATLCWANEGGGGIYTGVSQSLLSCTSSDTCAKDPLLFDDASKEGLVYCGSCPSSSGLRFGCDTYIQRCVCGVMENTKTECTKNSDCSVPQNSMCGISSTIEDIRGSYISKPCGSCGGMQMEPICILDGKGAFGVCGCGSVVSSLLKCKTEQIGSSTMALFSNKLCATILDFNKVDWIMNTGQSVSLDFSEIAVASCGLSSLNLCMDVSAPFSSFSGNTDLQLVVLLKLLSIVQPQSSSSSRRLLSETDLLGHSHAAHDNLTQPLYNEWVSLILEESPCQLKGMNRDGAKQCLNSFAMAKYVVNHFNLSEMKGKESRIYHNLGNGPIGNLWTFRMYLDRPGLFSFLMDLDPFTKQLRQNSGIIQGYLGNIMKVNNRSDIWQEAMHHGRRRLLQDDRILQTVDWNFNCTSLQKPMKKIINAFWSTVHFYERRGESNLSQTNSSTNCSLNTGITDCIGYSIPSQVSSTDQGSFFQTISKFTLYAPTLGIGGERVLDAILSPMSYEDAVKGNFITGRRIINDMGTCNYTQITLGGEQERSFMVILVVLVILFQILTTMCMPLSCCQWAMWVFLFPTIFFWAMYNTSPLCWPMIPTNFVHDVYIEVTYFLPQNLRVPKFLVKPHCTLNGKLEDGSYDPMCFASCAEPPFLFVSWQDSLMWWICEVSTEKCIQIGEYLSMFGPLFKDMVSSSDYYASVINYSTNDPEFVQAHRLCAFFSFYQVIFLMITLVITCYLIPTIIMGVIEVFMGCVVLLMDTYIADG